MSSPIRRAVIVAAGRSSRLYPLTLDTPKGLLEIGGEKLLGRSIRLLREAGVEQIAMVVGFQRQKLQEAFAADGVHFIHNPFFAETNNLGSLWFAREWVRENDFFYLHSDIIYEDSMLGSMTSGLGTAEGSFLTDTAPTDEEAMKVRANDGFYVESSKAVPPAEAYGEWVGIAAFRAETCRVLFETMGEVLEERLFQSYDTEGFNRMAERGHRFKIVPTEKRPWVEIDFEADLKRAREIFK